MPSKWHHFGGWTCNVDQMAQNAPEPRSACLGARNQASSQVANHQARSLRAQWCFAGSHCAPLRRWPRWTLYVCDSTRNKQKTKKNSGTRTEDNGNTPIDCSRIQTVEVFGCRFVCEKCFPSSFLRTASRSIVTGPQFHVLMRWNPTHGHANSIDHEGYSSPR